MRKRERDKTRHKSKLFIVISLLLLLLLLIATFVYLWLRVMNLPKFSLVVKTENGGGDLLVIDSKADAIKRYVLGQDLIFDSANGYGEYKIASLWTLGEKEGFDGELVARSVASNYLIPIYHWHDGHKSNLNLYQKIKLRLINPDRIEVDKELNSFDLPNTILINFVDQAIQESGVNIEMEDLTGDPKTTEKVSKIIDILGSKITGYSKGYDKDLDCEISGGNIDVLNTLSNVLGCEVTSQEGDSVVKIRLGAKFADRF